MKEEGKCSSKEPRTARGENNADAHQLHSISAVRSGEQNKQRKNGATEQRGNQYITTYVERIILKGTEKNITRGEVQSMQMLANSFSIFFIFNMQKTSKGGKMVYYSHLSTQIGIRLRPNQTTKPLAPCCHTYIIIYTHVKNCSTDLNCL